MANKKSAYVKPNIPIQTEPAPTEDSLKEQLKAFAEILVTIYFEMEKNNRNEQAE